MSYDVSWVAQMSKFCKRSRDRRRSHATYHGRELYHLRVISNPAVRHRMSRAVPSTVTGKEGSTPACAIVTGDVVTDLVVALEGCSWCEKAVRISGSERSAVTWRLQAAFPWPRLQTVRGGRRPRGDPGQGCASGVALVPGCKPHMCDVDARRQRNHHQEGKHRRPGWTACRCTQFVKGSTPCPRTDRMPLHFSTERSRIAFPDSALRRHVHRAHRAQGVAQLNAKGRKSPRRQTTSDGPTYGNTAQTRRVYGNV